MIQHQMDRLLITMVPMITTTMAAHTRHWQMMIPSLVGHFYIMLSPSIARWALRSILFQVPILGCFHLAVVHRASHIMGRVTLSVWIFSATGFGLEAVSAFFDQVSNPQKLHYALYGMLFSIVAVLVCILDLILNAMDQSTVTSGNIWDILPEVFGLALACVQCISSALQFSFLCRHAANPVKVSFVPFLFFFVLFAFKYRNGRS